MDGFARMYSSPFDHVCPADVFHEVVAEIVVSTSADLPGMTQEQVLQQVLKAMLLMAIPAGEC